MKLRTLLAALLVSFSASLAHAADAPTLKDDVDAETKAAIESALSANKSASEANVEWIWADPVDNMWTGSLQNNSDILAQAIEMANSGKNEEAKKVAAFIEKSANNGLEQAQKAPEAGPAQYGL